MKIAWFWADLQREWISSMWRVQFPHTGLLKAGYESRITSAYELLESAYHPNAGWADIIVIERLLFGPWQQRIAQWKKDGKKVFATFDDAYWDLPDYMPSKAAWTKENLRAFYDTLGIVDGTIVPSVNLRRALTKHGPVHFIPNYPDLSFPAYKYAFDMPVSRDEGRHVIGWGGSHPHSVPQLLPVFKKIIEIEPRVQIWTIGGYGTRDMLRELPPDYRRHFSPLPYGNYLHLVKHFDVFAIPLSGSYDKCRSWIKPLEAALMGVPWVATKSRIYEDCQGGVLVKKNKGNWVRALLSPPEHGKEWAMQQDITQHIGEYLEVFNG